MISESIAQEQSTPARDTLSANPDDSNSVAEPNAPDSAYLGPSVHSPPLPPRPAPLNPPTVSAEAPESSLENTLELEAEAEVDAEVPHRRPRFLARPTEENLGPHRTLNLILEQTHHPWLNAWHDLRRQRNE